MLIESSSLRNKSKILERLKGGSEQDPAAQQQAQATQEAQMAQMQAQMEQMNANLEKTQSETEKNRAASLKSMAEAESLVNQPLMTEQQMMLAGQMDGM